MEFNFKSLKKTFLLFFRKDILNKPEMRTRCFLAFLLILIDVAVASLVPYCSKEIIDTLSLNILNSVWLAVFFLGFFWILAKTVSHIQEIIFFPVINIIIRELNFHLVKHIHNISLPHYQSLSIPEVINCARRISYSARSFIKIIFLMIIPTTCKLFVATLVTIKMGFFGILLLPAILFSIIALYKGTKWYVAARSSAWQLSDEVTTRLSDSILNTKIVRYFETFEMGKIGNLLTKEAELWKKTNTRLHAIHVMIGALLGLTITAILGFAVVAIQHQTLTIGDFVLLQGQLIAAFLPLKTFSVEYRQLAESLVDIRKVIQIFEIPPQANSNATLYSNPLQPEIIKGIVLEKVTFSHEPNHPLFENLSLNILPGEKIGIVGESGCGKSSFIHLVAALYKPVSGSVNIHGHNINHISKKELSNFLHFIPQDFRLFNASLRENLTYGSDVVSEEHLIKIAEQMGLMELIAQMPLGFDTLVGEMGIKLSGGEKQKVALARALLLRPDILLLDETTNSLNIESEQKLLNIIFQSIPTVILVCHKAISLPGLNRILRMHRGEFKEIKIPALEHTYV